MVTAHWEESAPTVSTHPKPDMLFDYYGFPDSAYKYSYPAAGSPEVAAEATALLAGAGFSPKNDAKRGFDHGTFVPLMLMYPEAKTPVVQMSLTKGLDPVQHLKMGAALAPLRDQGVLIVGSGEQSLHKSAL